MYSLVVPVLPRRSARPSASARRPVPRVITSFMMSFMRKQTCGEITCAAGTVRRAVGASGVGGTTVALIAAFFASSASDTAFTAGTHSAQTVRGSAE